MKKCAVYHQSEGAGGGVGIGTRTGCEAQFVDPFLMSRQFRVDE